MCWRKAVVPAAVLALAAAPAAASPAQVFVADPCGDAAPVAAAGGQTVDAPGDRRDAFDIRWVAATAVPHVPGAVDVAVDLCNDAPTDPLLGSSWSVRWQLPGDCAGVLTISDGLRSDGVGQTRRGHLAKHCTQFHERPVTGGVSSTTHEVYSVELPAEAWRVAGTRLAFSLREDGGLGAAAEQLRPGTPWTGLSASTRDGRQITALDLDGQVRLTGPGTSDHAGPGGAFVVP